MLSHFKTMFLPVLLASFCAIHTVSTVSTVRIIKHDTAVPSQMYFDGTCFPLPNGGCQCTIKEQNGLETMKYYDSDEQCKVSVEAQAIKRKKQLNKELESKYNNFKENCFPKPSGGCRCNEKDSAGNDVMRMYENNEECKISQDDGHFSKRRRAISERPSQNVRDPVRERAQVNYRAVINELNEKFKGLKEGCFPRPRGCLCVVGKDQDGRDITERRMKDRDCKCQAGEHGNGCRTHGL